jgi:glycerol-3-phosphate acyltransferase PlsY
MTEALAIVLGYLLGSIPSAYLATRWAGGGDIRRLGGGNVGGLNVFREIGVGPALAVSVVDIGKGAAAVAIAYWGLKVPEAYVLLAGLAAVAGHNWMVWLKFSGGKGMGATFGVLAVLLPLHGYSLLLGIFIAVIIVPLAITRNVALSMGIGLLALPFIIWFGTGSGYAIIVSIALVLVITAKFLPTALGAIRKSGMAAFGVDRWQRNKKDS